jgi:hypothetical protein
MGSARPSVTKRQREQVKRERRIRKEERRAERKHNAAAGNEQKADEESQ